VVLSRGCAICLVLLVISPVTAPFRTLDAFASSATSRAALSVPAADDPAYVDDATVTTDPVLAQSIRFDAVILLAASCGVCRPPLSGAGSPPVRTSGAPGGCSRVSPVLRV
jgi:hypothetical protein